MPYTTCPECGSTEFDCHAICRVCGFTEYDQPEDTDEGYLENPLDEDDVDGWDISL